MRDVGVGDGGGVLDVRGKVAETGAEDDSQGWLEGGFGLDEIGSGPGLGEEIGSGWFGHSFCLLGRLLSVVPPTPSKVCKVLKINDLILHLCCKGVHFIRDVSQSIANKTVSRCMLSLFCWMDEYSSINSLAICEG